MPSTQFSEAALERRREKFAYAAGLPLADWDAAAGKTVDAVLVTAGARVVLFTDGAFLIAQPGPAGGDALMAVLAEAREALLPLRASDLLELDRLAAAEREAMRLARMEKVLGAVETNLAQIPELRETLRALLDVT